VKGVKRFSKFSIKYQETLRFLFDETSADENPQHFERIELIEHYLP